MAVYNVAALKPDRDNPTTPLAPEDSLVDRVSASIPCMRRLRGAFQPRCRLAPLLYEIARLMAIASPSTPWTSSQPVDRRFESHASIVLIGIPGVGKRSLGFIAAHHLKRRLRTENRGFKAHTGLSKAAFLEQHGREALLRASLPALEHLLQENASGCIIECGANSLTPESREVLATYALTHPVVYILRDPADVMAHCRLPPLEISRLRSVDAGHRNCSNFEFFNVFDDGKAVDEGMETEESDLSLSPAILHKAKLSFCHFIEAIMGRTLESPGRPFYNAGLRIHSNQRSYLRVWKVSALISKSPWVLHDADGVHAVELVVDIWAPNIIDDISRFVAEIRHHLGLSIVYSVDLESSGSTERSSLEAVMHGLRLGVALVVIDGYAPDDVQQWLLRSKGHAAAMAHFDFGGKGFTHAWLHEDRYKDLSMAQHRGYDVVRLVQHATDPSDNDDVQYFRHMAKRERVPVVAYNTGTQGRTSKTQNDLLTPVEPLPAPSMEQSTSWEYRGVSLQGLTKALFASWQYDPLRFHVFGSEERAFSRSPEMYKAAFERYGLAHRMEYTSAASVQDLLTSTRDGSFGGACISFPFKETVSEVCTMRSTHADAIGSVNSILPIRFVADADPYDLMAQASRRNRRGPSVGLYGDNSDWLAFHACIRRHQSPRNAVLGTQDTALVLGAGGSARSAIYALIILGYRNIYVRNRTLAKADSVANHFNKWCQRYEHQATNVKVLDAIESEWPEGIRVPTCIIACVPTDSDYCLPNFFFHSNTGGIAVEVFNPSSIGRVFWTKCKQINYRHQRSLFLDQARVRGLAGGKSWTVVDGYEILIETAILQFEFFSGYRAPRATMSLHLRKAS
ncbi:hypothetical protein LTR17_024843 [Elasticomyces elasticus]|nr:hypothetical protein LTR17_024843 [Elasticomyces elasticus]